jgi:SP family sugar:H+ symporter-like MFS transporter
MRTNPQPDTRYVSLMAAGAALGGFLFGFDTSTINSAIVGIGPTLRLGTGEVGFVAAIALIGCAVGAWCAGAVSERLGRNRVMTIAGLAVMLGSVAAALTSHVALLGLVRFLTGLGIGAASAVVPAYIAEISPTSIRGRLGTFWQFAIVIGQFLGLLVGYGLTAWAGSEAAALPWGGAAWRWMFVVVALLAAIYAMIARALPQSPADLIRHGHPDQARALLVRLNDPAVDERMIAIEETQTAKSEVSTIKDLRGPRLGLLPIVWIGILLAAFQQLVGINVVKTYSNTLWQTVGFSTNSAFAISLFTVGVSIASTVVAIIVMDKIGRRTLLLTGAAFMALALGTMAFCFATATGGSEDLSLSLGREAGIIALVAMNVFAVAFGITWGPIMWLMLGELFSSDIRTTAVAVCVSVNWMTNWLVTRTFPWLAGTSLGFTYGLYAAFALLALLFVWKALPETRGRTLA